MRANQRAAIVTTLLLAGFACGALAQRLWNLPFGSDDGVSPVQVAAPSERVDDTEAARAAPRRRFRDLKLRPETFALDIGCGSGQATVELLTRLDERSRVFALEADPALVTLAKARVRPEWKNRVYFKPGNFDEVTGMAADTYDLTVANLVLGEEVHDWRAALVELIRVTKPGGQILASLRGHRPQPQRAGGG